MKNKVNDLRSALALLKDMPEQLISTDVEVDPMAQLAGVYRYVGAGGTVARPTKEGPAMIFNHVKGHPGAKVAIGVLASRKRVAALLDCAPQDLGKKLYQCVDHPIPPVRFHGQPPCQEVVHKADDPDFDLYKLVPAPTNTPDDAGPYITLGMCYATHPETGAHDVTIHRLCIQGKDELSIFFTPGARHIGAMAERAEALGQKLPISISIGVDPAIEIGSCFEPPTTPLGYDELSVAGIPTEASIYGMVEKAMPGRLQNVYCASAGGGKYMAVLQFKKSSPSDEGRQRQAALLAFSAFSELKHVFLVDEDVDCFDMNDVLWAMNTRFQGDADIITIPGVRCHPLDPSNDPRCSSSIRDHGIACKTIFDCTVPYDQKDRFRRAKFMEVDPNHWLKGESL